MFRYFYNIGIFIYDVLIHIAGLWNAQAKRWKSGREHNLENLKAWKRENTKPVIWVHCASHGEYEQGLPLIEKIRSQQKEVAIVVTFFSPSGYDAIAHGAKVDWVGYIPIDRPAPMRTFIDELDPSITIFIKNEWWWNTLDILHEKDVPVHFVSSTIRKSHYFLNYSWEMIVSGINKCSSFGVVDDLSLSNLVDSFPQLHAYNSGDMRIDRVLNVVNSNLNPLPQLEGLPCIIYGSVWLTDIAAMKSIINFYQDYVHVVFPHVLSDKNIAKISTELNAKNISEQTVLNNGEILIVQKMGVLSSAYQYGSMAYVGGGYQEGIHNVLEPAVYRIPIMIGPKNTKSTEAQYLKERDIIRVLGESPNMPDLNDSTYLQNVDNSCQDYFNQHRGATDITYNHIFGESRV